ncbi:alpha/beta hydrolase [Nitrobacter sp.]|uniref:alpha/beta hydrolase n=1 Tax=Nitrobacter sp. TaxID=29420 RepID=UPI0029CAB19B|nr:alpha/beta hydrolase [Nitrobacter sp.]
MVEDLIRNGPNLSALAPAQLRIAYDAIGGVTPASDDIVYQTVSANGVPAELGRAPGSDPVRTILYFHGGGYVIGSIASHRGLVARLGIAAKARTLAVDYRLAPEAPYPAASDDAIAAYRWLLDQGLKANMITFAGDSAGGGLALATLIRARDESLPRPAGIALMSPFVDLSCSALSIRDKAVEDILVSETVVNDMASAYLGDGDRHAAYASPLFADLTGLPPVLIHMSSSEVLLDDSVRLLGALGRANVPTSLRMWTGIPHVWQLFSAILDEGQESLSEAGRFLATQMDKADNDDTTWERGHD